MAIRYSAPAAVALAVILASCSQAPTPAPDTREADAKAIRDLEAGWMKALATRDLNKVAVFYADDASFFPPDAPVLTGTAAIKAAMESMVADQAFSLSFASTKVQVAKAGDLAYSQGAYTMTMTAPKSKRVLTETGKYVTVFKKQADGGWKAVADIINADAPAAPANRPVQHTAGKRRARHGK
jgi:uncharacterized protein (TIGR02246 family)